MGNKVTFQLKSFGATDIGRRRQVNQDAFLCDDDLGLWVVADGMGGHAAGEVASHESVEAVYGMVKRGKPEIAGSDQSEEAKTVAGMRLLEGAVQHATYLVFGMAEQDSGMTGMGTTMSAMMSMGSQVIIAQVGDSRIYRIRRSEVLQLTEDHTLVAWQIKQGLLTVEQAATARHRNVITRAVGNRDYVQVDMSAHDIEHGDTFLLCSDGLHGYLGNEEIPAIVGFGGAQGITQFIDLANSRGGRDNITAVMVEARN